MNDVSARFYPLAPCAPCRRKSYSSIKGNLRVHPNTSFECANNAGVNAIIEQVSRLYMEKPFGEHTEGKALMAELMTTQHS
jgi:hypothetical protein